MIEWLVVGCSSRLTVQANDILFDNRGRAEYLLELSVLIFLSRVLLIGCLSSILRLRLNIFDIWVDLLTIIILEQVHLWGYSCGRACWLVRIAPILVCIKVISKMTPNLHILRLWAWNILLHIVLEIVDVGRDNASNLFLEVLLLLFFVWIRLRGRWRYISS